MKIRVVISLLFLIIISDRIARADQLGCHLGPKEINTHSLDIVQTNFKDKTDIDDNMLWSTSAKVRIGNIQPDDYRISGEGFLRPIRSESYVIIEPLLLTANLARSNNVVYLCAHDDEDFSKTHVTLYFLSGYGLERKGIKNGFDNLLHKPSLKISPLNLSIFGISQGVRELSAIFGHIPIVNLLAALPLEVLRGIQNDVAAAINDIGGVGVERVVLRSDTIELASGVDVNDPTKAKIIKTIQLHGQLIMKNTELQNQELKDTYTE